MLSKKSNLLFAILGSVFSVAFFFTKDMACGAQMYTACTRLFDQIAESSMIFFLFLFFSFLTFFVHEKVFRSWNFFAIPWLLLSIVLVAFSTESSGGIIFPSNREIAIQITTILFIILSLD